MDADLLRHALCFCKRLKLLLFCTVHPLWGGILLKKAYLLYNAFGKKSYSFPVDLMVSAARSQKGLQHMGRNLRLQLREAARRLAAWLCGKLGIQRYLFPPHLIFLFQCAYRSAHDNA